LINPLISIIIPVYNAEAFLEKCINSLINQTYQNIEILIVDDCSTDNSYKILEDFAQKDARIKLYSTGVNGGPGVARDIALKNAQGEYIMFCDNDDSYEPNMCEIMCKTIIEQDVDLVTCKSNIKNSEWDNELTRYININKTGYYKLNANPLLELSVHLWDKIFKKSILDKYEIGFTKYSGEDDLFVEEYISVIKTYYGLTDKLYNFVIHKKSYTHVFGKGKDRSKRFDRLHIIEQYADFINKNNLISEIPQFVKHVLRNNLRYVFRFYKLSLFDIIYYIICYQHCIKDINVNKDLSIWNLYLRLFSPMFIIKSFYRSIWI